VILPATLGVPRRPASGLPAGVLVECLVIEVEDLPTGARSMAKAALAAGWEVMVTYARAASTRKLKNALAPDAESKDTRKYELVDVPCELETWAVRTLDPLTEHRWALWERKAETVEFVSSWALTASGCARLTGTQAKVFPKARGSEAAGKALLEKALSEVDQDQDPPPGEIDPPPEGGGKGAP
jgi:hypothetical protein